MKQQKVVKELSDAKKNLERMDELEKQNAKKKEIMDNLISKLKEDNDLLTKQLNKAEDVIKHKEIKKFGATLKTFTHLCPLK